jgi:hypothetical protein
MDSQGSLHPAADACTRRGLGLGVSPSALPPSNLNTLESGSGLGCAKSDLGSDIFGKTTKGILYPEHAVSSQATEGGPVPWQTVHRTLVSLRYIALVSTLKHDRALAGVLYDSGVLTRPL